MPHGHWQISTLFTTPTHKPFAVLFPPASRHLPVGYPVHKYEVASSFSITPCHDWVPTHLRQIRQVFHVPFTKLYVFGIVHGNFASTFLVTEQIVHFSIVHHHSGTGHGNHLGSSPLSEKGVLRSETCRLCQFTPSCQTMRYWGTSLSGLRQ